MSNLMKTKIKEPSEVPGTEEKQSVCPGVGRTEQGYEERHGPRKFPRYKPESSAKGPLLLLKKRFSSKHILRAFQNIVNISSVPSEMRGKNHMKSQNSY